MFLYKFNILFRWFFPKYVWKIPTNRKVIYLTFDDGPIPEITQFVLDTLEKQNAKATFFCIGDNVRKNPLIFNKILANGHSIGNHTFNHLKGWSTDNKQYIDNFEQCNSILPSHNLFRPPYGKINRKQAREIMNTHKIIMWDVLSGDYSLDLLPENILKKCIKYTDPGTIILFHDSVKASRNLKAVLPKYIAHFKELGYTFEPIIFD